MDALIDQHLEYEDAVRFGPAPPDAAEINAAFDKLRERLKAEGKDPDDLVKTDGSDAFRSVLADARPLADLVWMRETSGGVFDTNCTAQAIGTPKTVQTSATARPITSELMSAST